MRNKLFLLLISSFLSVFISCGTTDNHSKNKGSHETGNKDTQGKLEVVGIFYEQSDPDTNFLKMITEKKYNDSLFIFNDNEEQHKTDTKGGGNAGVRPYNKYGKHQNYPRSAGIQTGKNGKGYISLAEGKDKIDASLTEIKDLIKKYKYKRIFYSKASKNDPLIGQAIFQINQETRAYITKNILSLKNISTKERPDFSKGKAKVISANELENKLGWKIPTAPNNIDNLPLQKGDSYLGQTVTVNGAGDLPWTAFTLVVFLNKNGKYEIMTQKRSFGRSKGSLETAGGHLRPNQTFSQGAKEELEQESGIKIESDSLIYQLPTVNNLQAKKSTTSGKLYLNANFFLAFSGEKPKTENSSNEIDSTYGHKWLDLKTVYLEAKAEQKANWKKHGKYYSFFRPHLIDFCERVLPAGWDS